MTLQMEHLHMYACLPCWLQVHAANVALMNCPISTLCAVTLHLLHLQSISQKLSSYNSTALTV